MRYDDDDDTKHNLKLDKCVTVSGYILSMFGPLQVIQVWLVFSSGLYSWYARGQRWLVVMPAVLAAVTRSSLPSRSLLLAMENLDVAVLSKLYFFGGGGVWDRHAFVRVAVNGAAMARSCWDGGRLSVTVVPMEAQRCHWRCC